MAPEHRFLPRFAAEPPQEDLPYGRWAERLGEEFLAGVAQLDVDASPPAQSPTDPLTGAAQERKQTATAATRPPGRSR